MPSVGLFFLAATSVVHAMKPDFLQLTKVQVYHFSATENLLVVCIEFIGFRLPFTLLYGLF